MRIGQKLLAVEPKRFGVVSDCKVPFGDFSFGAGNQDPARIKTASLRLARVSKG